MEQPNLQFREIQPSDYAALEKIISDTWNYEGLCSPNVAKALSRVYLATCLANQTYACVALNKNEPVGIIMGKDQRQHRTPLRYALGQFTSILAMMVKKEGRRVLKLFSGYEEINKALLAQCPRQFDGEVAFFAVRSDQRGAGVGKALFQRLQAHMKAQGICNFYLFTDSTCNYGFYEHQGMERLCQKTHVLTDFSNKELEFFLYGYQG